MIVKAIEDLNEHLTKGENYPVLDECENTYTLVNDKGFVGEYFKHRFETIQTIQTNQTVKHANGKTYEVKEVDGVVSLVEFVEPPIIGELCLFSDDEESLSANFGKVGFLTVIGDGFFNCGTTAWNYCKPIKTIK